MRWDDPPRVGINVILKDRLERIAVYRHRRSARGRHCRLRLRLGHASVIATRRRAPCSPIAACGRRRLRIDTELIPAHRIRRRSRGPRKEGHPKPPCRQLRRNTPRVQQRIIDGSITHKDATNTVASGGDELAPSITIKHGEADPIRGVRHRRLPCPLAAIRIPSLQRRKDTFRAIRSR